MAAVEDASTRGDAVSRIVSLLLLVVATGCSGFGTSGEMADDCDTAGCDSQVTWQLSDELPDEGPLAVRACVEDDCVEDEVSIGTDGCATSDRLRVCQDEVTLTLPPDVEYGDPVGVELLVSSVDSGDTLAESTEEDVQLEREQPNGEQCPPTCWQATIEV
jgi:hypothetical protein